MGTDKREKKKKGRHALSAVSTFVLKDIPLKKWPQNGQPVSQPLQYVLDVRTDRVVKTET